MNQRRLRRLAEEGSQSLPECLLMLLLAPLGLIYGVLAWLRVCFYRCGLFSVYRAPVPVIAVGNLTMGGTGKTPVVDFLVKELLVRGERVAVVSRGYRGRGGGAVKVVADGSGRAPLLSAEEAGDEPYLLARRNPHAVVIAAPLRRLGVAAAVDRFGATVVVLDDAYQHLAVARDLNLLLLDAAHPFGNGKVLPAGLLREFPSQISRADLILLTRITTEHSLPPLPPAIPTLHCRYTLGETLHDLAGNPVPVQELRGRRPLAFAGIARPDGFFRSLAELGLSPVATLALDDHADLDPRQIEAINALAGGGDFFVTTEKDGVKLRANQLKLPCYQVSLTLQLTPASLLLQRIEGVLS